MVGSYLTAFDGVPVSHFEVDWHSIDASSGADNGGNYKTAR